MKLTFIGCGSAFTTKEYYQSNLLITKNGKNFLIDIGGDARFSMAELGLKATDIDAFTLTHAHADHVGGIEWLAFSTFFIPNRPHPKLYGIGSLLNDIWNKSLAGGLESIEGAMVKLEDYFDVVSIKPNEDFIWENIKFQPVQTVHVMNGFRIIESYGYIITDLDTNGTVFFTGDTQFAPHQLIKFYDMVDVIFHDCETSPFKSSVHAHYDFLRTLNENIKSKMWLYHYQPNPTQDPIAEGFKGFVTKGQSFEI